MSADDQALARAMAELDVDPAYLPELRLMAATDRSSWRACCGLLCTPCVLDLARVVDRARALAAKGDD